MPFIPREGRRPSAAPEGAGGICRRYPPPGKKSLRFPESRAMIILSIS